jgi:hypothetical protein
MGGFDVSDIDYAPSDCPTSYVDVGIVDQRIPRGNCVGAEHTRVRDSAQAFCNFFSGMELRYQHHELIVAMPFPRESRTT